MTVDEPSDMREPPRCIAGQRRWDGLRVVVSGAARGVGLACARALASRGARLFLCDIDSLGLAAATQEVSGVGRLCDVASEASIAMLAADIQLHFASVDVLINAAGQGYVRTLGMMRMTRALLPMMVIGDGRRADVFNVAAAERDEAAGFFPYAASASAFARLSDALAEQVEGTGVVLTGIVPDTSTSGPPAAAATAEQILALIDSTIDRRRPEFRSASS